MVLAHGFDRSVLAEFVALAAAGVPFFVSLIWVRVWFEAATVFFQIADHAAEVVEQAAEIA